MSDLSRRYDAAALEFSRPVQFPGLSRRKAALHPKGKRRDQSEDRELVRGDVHSRPARASVTSCRRTYKVIQPMHNPIMLHRNTPHSQDRFTSDLEFQPRRVLPTASAILA